MKDNSKYREQQKLPQQENLEVTAKPRHGITPKNFFPIKINFC